MRARTQPLPLDDLRYTRTLDGRPPPLPHRRPEITVTAPEYEGRQDYLHPVMHDDYLTPSIVENGNYLMLVAGRDTVYPQAPAPTNDGAYIHPVISDNKHSYIDIDDDYQEAR